MKIKSTILFLSLVLATLLTCTEQAPKQAAEDVPVTTTVTAADILGNADYLAYSYGGYRQGNREAVPSVADLKEDLAILAAMNVKLLRTYNTQQFAQAANLLQAIKEMKTADTNFEMYVMLGAWIDCEGAWTETVNHEAESLANNTAEIAAAVRLANSYPDIVKMIAVGNEAMVHWAASYFVRPAVILKWVNHLQGLKAAGQLPADLWVTSSDNFASWGGGEDSYHNDDLTALAQAVDFVSLHTYPFHDSHYNGDYWKIPAAEQDLSKLAQIDAAMLRARDYAKAQYTSTAAYLKSVGVEKPIHIGETGWASVCNALYGPNGSHAADEYKAKRYHDHLRAWTAEAGISCFYFEAFDEQWKDAANPQGSENHFGMINLQGEAKYALWELVDAGTFTGLTRNGKAITKTYQGDEAALLKVTLTPPTATNQ